MLELIARGKSLGNGEWIEGNYNYIRHMVTKSGKVYEYKHIIVPFFLNENDEMDTFVDQKTLGLYTELNDDEGARIFEGDIVEIWGHGEQSLISVEWFCGAFHAVYADDGTTELLDKVIYEGADCTCVVIGNIHDDPQLLAVVGESAPDLDHSGLNTGDPDC